MPCKRCNDMIEFDDLFNVEFFQPSFAALKSSAESGCNFCILVYAAITSSRTAISEGIDIETLCSGRNVWISKNPTDTAIHVNISHFRDDNLYSERALSVSKLMIGIGDVFVTGSDLHVSADEGTWPARNISGRLPIRNPGGDAAMATIREWIHACDRGHKNCALLSVDQPLPKRILNIENKPIVWETKGATGRYAALSYCWGRSGRNILLTKDKGTAGQSPTFDQFTTVGIDMDQLAKTIQDAILVCRALGLKYLWVDALCIVQEERDFDDFRIEVPRISEYYSNAYVTIIAGSAKDCKDGFLNERLEPKVAPCLISYSGRHSKKNMGGYVKLSLPLSRDNGPVNERAWTYQEGIMSKRYLLYGLDQFHFRCQQYIRYEDGDFSRIFAPDDHWKFHLTGGMNILEQDIDPSVHNLNEHSGEEGMNWQSYAYFVWSKAIAPYTRRKMSESLDKLAAIAGFAKYCQKIISCKYMYGLWEDYLCDELLWKVHVPVIDNSTHVRRVENRAPSWSWASVDGPVLSRGSNPNDAERLEDKKNCRLTILRHDGVPGSLDPLRDPNAGPDAFKLIVRGHIRQLWWSPRLYRGQVRDLFLYDKKNFDSQTVAEFRTEETRNESRSKRIAMGTWDSHDDYSNELGWENPVYALQILQCSRDRSLGTGLAGILLRQVDTSIYQRIGHFKAGKRQFFDYLPPEELTLI